MHRPHYYTKQSQSQQTAKSIFEISATQPNPTLDIVATQSNPSNSTKISHQNRHKRPRIPHPDLNDDEDINNNWRKKVGYFLNRPCTRRHWKHIMAGHLKSTSFINSSECHWLSRVFGSHSTSITQTTSWEDYNIAKKTLNVKMFWVGNWFVATGRLYVVWSVWSWEPKPLVSRESCTTLARMDNIELVLFDRMFHTTYVLFLFEL